MRIFKRGVGQAAPLAKSVSVTELLLRGEAARTAVASDDTRKAAPGRRKGALEELNAAAKEAQEGMRGSTLL
jgi:hypothetical protein